MKIDKGTKKILQEAKALLSKRGKWVQEAYGESDGKNFCAVGAVRHAIWQKQHDSYHDHSRAVSGEKKALKALNYALPDCFFTFPEDRELGGYEGEIPDYNDASGRRKQDVLALFDYAIKGKRMPSPKKKERD